MATPKFISIDDFVGDLNLDFGNEGFDNNMAAKIEKEILIMCFGFQLYTAIISDLDENDDPQSTKYDYLINGIEAGYTDSSGYLQRLEGAKEMLKHFFYCEFLSDRQTHHTSTGIVEAASVNAVQSYDGLNKKYVRAYNLGVDYFNQLRDYILYQNSVEGEDFYENFEYEQLKYSNTLGI